MVILTKLMMVMSFSQNAFFKCGNSGVGFLTRPGGLVLDNFQIYKFGNNLRCVISKIGNCYFLTVCSVRKKISVLHDMLRNMRPETLCRSEIKKDICVCSIIFKKDIY